ncbi:MAG: ethylbenzene dehydrogenase-related protein [Caldivirga sp.]|jgi:hypothetical protein|uniref:ethylbenzene dehydrogenase-related protein n=3 Tax=Caldivirga sp. TaxID=2080243 RepID=UPI003D0F44D6
MGVRTVLNKGGVTMKLIIIITVATVAGLLYMLYPIPLAQTPTGIMAYKVVGNANLQNPGSEAFWSRIPWFNVSLVPNLSTQMLPIPANVPTSGEVPYVMVKAAWNGSYIFILVKWPDPYGPSLVGPAAIAGPGHWTMVYNPNGPLNITFLKIMTSTFHKSYFIINSSFAVIKGSPRPMEYILAYVAPHYGVYFYGYYVNLTTGHYYPDRVAIMWYMGSEQSPSDCMNIGGPHPNYAVSGELSQLMKSYVGSNIEQYTGGSLSSGAADIWEWISGATYPSGQNFNYFTNVTWDVENGIDEAAASAFSQSPHGFFINLLTNQTGLYDIGDGGIWYPNATGPEPGYFSNYAGAKYEDGYWIVEFVRPLQAPMPYTVNLTPGQTYNVAFGVWVGKAGETSWDKSISASFIPLTIATATPSVTPPIPAPVIVVAVVGIVVSLVAIGLIFYSIRRR